MDIEVASLKSKQKAYNNYKKQITLDSKFKSQSPSKLKSRN